MVEQALEKILNLVKENILSVEDAKVIVKAICEKPQTKPFKFNPNGPTTNTTFKTTF